MAIIFLKDRDRLGEGLAYMRHEGRVGPPITPVYEVFMELMNDYTSIGFVEASDFLIKSRSTE